jgi:hypothetical protein
MKQRKRSSVPKPKGVSLRLNLPVTVTIKPGEFHYLKTLESVDQGKLRKGKHTIEVGYLQTPTCKKLVKAVVINGMITDFEVEPCKGGVLPSAELRKVMTLALKKYTGGAGRPRPIPIAQFIAQEIEVGGRFPCIWIIVGGWVFGCCLIIPWLPIAICRLLPFPPTRE